MLKTSTEIGTTFSVEVDGREYWLTAKHLITGVKHPPFGSIRAKQISLSVLDPTVEEVRWLSYEFSILDPGENIDIAILVPKRSIQQFPIPSLPLQSDVPIGGECEFLGFPFASSWMANFSSTAAYRMPFIKHCYVSGRAKIPNPVWILDGINNEGFSGGPVIVNTGTEQKIIAVVSGYESQNSDVISIPVKEKPPVPKPTSTKSEKPSKQKNVVQTNTGLIFAFDTSSALDVIRKNPIGPLVEAK